MEDKIREYFAEHGLEYCQTIVFKGLYEFLFVTHKALFDACLYDIEGRKIWYVDVDLTKKWKLFVEASCSLNQILILTPEMPYRLTGVEEMLKTLQKFRGGLSTKRKGSLDASVIIVRNAKNLKK